MKKAIKSLLLVWLLMADIALAEPCLPMQKVAMLAMSKGRYVEVPDSAGYVFRRTHPTEYIEYVLIYYKSPRGEITVTKRTAEKTVSIKYDPATDGYSIKTKEKGTEEIIQVDRLVVCDLVTEWLTELNQLK